MAQLTINIPDAVVTRVLNAFAAVYEYPEIIGDGEPNPQTKAQFARSIVARFVRDVVKTHEANEAVEAARKAAETAAVNDIMVS